MGPYSVGTKTYGVRTKASIYQQRGEGSCE